MLYAVFIACVLVGLGVSEYRSQARQVVLIKQRAKHR